MLPGKCLRKLGHVSKMVMLGVLPSFMLLGISCYYLLDSIFATSKMKEGRDVIVYSIKLGQVLHSLQRERDQSVLYLSAIGSQTKTFLIAQYIETDQQLEVLSDWPDTLHNTDNYQTKDAFQAYLVQHRNELDLLGNSIFDEIVFYSDSIETFLRWLYDAVSQSRHTPLWKSLVAYQKVIRAIQDMGEERALGTYYFSHGGFQDTDKFMWYTKQVFNFWHSYGQARMYSDLVAGIETHEVTLAGKNLTDIINEYRDELLWSNSTNVDISKAITWFDYMTMYFDQLLAVQLELADALLAKIDETINKSTVTIVVSAIVLCAVIPMLFMLAPAVYRLSKDVQSLAVSLGGKTKSLLEERLHLESLLNDLLPDNVTTYMQQGISKPAEYFETVSIVNCKLVGFTDALRNLPPQAMVELVAEYYSLIETRVSMHNVYKVQTAGTSTMILSGVPIRNNRMHATETAEVTLNLLDDIRRMTYPSTLDAPIQIRIGIHSGAVVAGLVAGYELPHYFVFGEAVRLAQLMETMGEENRIHISRSTRSLLSTSNYKTTANHSVNMCHKSTTNSKEHIMTTFWLERAEPEYQPPPPACEPTTPRSTSQDGWEEADTPNGSDMVLEGGEGGEGGKGGEGGEGGEGEEAGEGGQPAPPTATPTAWGTTEAEPGDYLQLV